MNILLRPQLPFSLAGPLGPDEQRYWTAANKEVVWGWKRDVGMQSRAVYSRAAWRATVTQFT